ncbi:MAG: hypothetical protein WAV90_23375 [Gordonia amarae]
MRTTVDLPPELMRAAKIAAADRGVTLKDLLIRALSREVAAGASGGRRVTFPLISSDGPRVDVTNSDIEAALDAEDIEKYA